MEGESGRRTKSVSGRWQRNLCNAPAAIIDQIKWVG